MQRFSDFRKRSIKNSLRQLSVREGVDAHFDLLRLEMLDKLRLPSGLSDANLFENFAYQKASKQDYQDNCIWLEHVVEFCKNNFYHELISEASLADVEKEIHAKIDAFTTELADKISTALGASRAASSEPEAPAGSPSGAPSPSGAAPSPSGGTPRPSAGSGPGASHAPGAAATATYDDEPEAAPAAGPSGFTPAPRGSFRPSDGFWKGMGRLWNRATRPVRRIWHNDPTRENVERLEKLFNESSDDILASVKKFGDDLKAFISAKLPEITKDVAAATATSPSMAATGVPVRTADGEEVPTVGQEEVGRGGPADKPIGTRTAARMRKEAQDVGLKALGITQTPTGGYVLDGKEYPRFSGDFRNALIDAVARKYRDKSIPLANAAGMTLKGGRRDGIRKALGIDVPLSSYTKVIAAILQKIGEMEGAPAAPARTTTPEAAPGTPGDSASLPTTAIDTQQQVTPEPSGVPPEGSGAPPEGKPEAVDPAQFAVDFEAKHKAEWDFLLNHYIKIGGNRDVLMTNIGNMLPKYGADATRQRILTKVNELRAGASTSEPSRSAPPAAPAPPAGDTPPPGETLKAPPEQTPSDVPQATDDPAIDAAAPPDAAPGAAAPDPNEPTDPNDLFWHLLDKLEKTAGEHMEKSKIQGIVSHLADDLEKEIQGGRSHEDVIQQLRNMIDEAIAGNREHYAGRQVAAGHKKLGGLRGATESFVERTNRYKKLLREAALRPVGSNLKELLAG